MTTSITSTSRETIRNISRLVFILAEQFTSSMSFVQWFVTDRQTDRHYLCYLDAAISVNFVVKVGAHGELEPSGSLGAEPPAGPKGSASGPRVRETKPPPLKLMHFVSFRSVHICYHFCYHVG